MILSVQMKKPGSEKFGLALQPQHGKHNLDCKRVIIVRSPNLCHKDSNGDYLRKWKNFSGSDTFKFQPQDVPASNFFVEKEEE